MEYFYSLSNSISKMQALFLSLKDIKIVSINKFPEPMDMGGQALSLFVKLISEFAFRYKLFRVYTIFVYDKILLRILPINMNISVWAIKLISGYNCDAWAILFSSIYGWRIFIRNDLSTTIDWHILDLHYGLNFCSDNSYSLEPPHWGITAFRMIAVLSY